MPEPASPPAPEKTYRIRYDVLVGGAHNVDFKGEGRLIVRTAVPEYVFEGTPRKFRARETATLRLRPEDVKEVLAERNGIHLHTPLGEAGRQQRNFVFYCRDADEADEIAAHFPHARSTRSPERREFDHRLAAVAPRDPRWATVTNGLIATNVLVFAVLVFGFDAGLARVDDFSAYEKFAANYGPLTVGGEWWRLLTSMFSHYGVVHLLLNMWALAGTGDFLERLLGRTFFTLTYFASGLAGGFASLLCHVEPVWSAGASGAVFGVYGAVLGYFLHQRHVVPRAVYRSILKSLGVFAAYNVAWGLAHPNIDQAAHLGGALGGLAFGWLLARPLDPAARAAQYAPCRRRGWLAFAVLLVAGVGGSSLLKF